MANNMAIHHARQGELVDLARWPHDVEPGKSHTLIKTDNLTVARLALDKGKEINEYQIPDPIVIHCISGSVELITTRARQVLTAGQLLYLPGNDPHALVAMDDTIILLTIVTASG